MFYTDKFVRFVFSTVMILSLVFTLGGVQLASAQSKDLTNYTLLSSPGSLDSTFDNDGRVTTTFGTNSNVGRAIAIQSDGKIVVAGTQRNSSSFADFALARYNNDGSLDSSFGTNGKVITGFEQAGTRDIAIQTDGKIVVAGSGYDDLGIQSTFLARYNSNGLLDTSFDTDGKVITGIGEAEALAIQSDGKLLVTGSRDTAVTLDSEIVLARYNTNGSLDTTFDSDGYLTTNPGSYPDGGRSIILQSDGKILVGGFSYKDEFDPYYTLIRYNAGGSLDTGFSGDGIIITTFNNSADYEAGIALQPDGKIILAGSSYGLGPYLSAVIMRFNNNGTLDSTFDGDGKVSTSFANETQINDVALQSNGKIVVAGVNSPNNVHDSANDFLLVRYNADGSLDTSFDTDGKVTTDFGGDKDNGEAIAIQSDGNIVVAGSRAIDSTHNDFAVARYIGDPGPSTNVDINIGGSNIDNVDIPLGKSISDDYGINNGPVHVVSSDGVTPILTSQRAIYLSSFNSIVGYPGDQLTTDYWFTSYDNKGMITYLVIGNPDPAQTALVDVYIGGNKMNPSGPYSLAPGQRIFPRYGINSGPVHVVSTNGVPIFTSERTKYQFSFNEVMGYPGNQLATEYWFTSYDDKGMITYLVVGNPHSSQTAEVDVYIGGNKMNASPYQIAPGQRIFPRYGVNSGPVRVVSTNGVNVFASERTKFGDTFNEVLGFPGNQVSSEFWFTSYDDTSMITYLVVGNPSSSQTAEVDVYIGGVKKNNTSIQIAPGQRFFQRYGLNSGPVRVVSTNGVDVFASERSKYLQSFNEILGLAGNQLATDYWFTSYDDTGMDTKLVISAP